VFRGLLACKFLGQLVGGVGGLGKSVLRLGGRLSLFKLSVGGVHLLGGFLPSFRSALRIEPVHLPGKVRLAVGGLLCDVRWLVRGRFAGFLGQVALFAGHLGSFGRVVVAAGEPVGQIAELVGRVALGLRLLLGLGGLLGPGKRIERLLLLALCLVAGADLFGFLRNLFFLLFRLGLGGGVGLVRVALGLGGGLGLLLGKTIGAVGFGLLAGHLLRQFVQRSGRLFHLLELFGVGNVGLGRVVGFAGCLGGLFLAHGSFGRGEFARLL